MEYINEVAWDILDISKKIYCIQEENNPTAIFSNKRFSIGTEENPDAVFVKLSDEGNNSFYYFESSEIIGAIIKTEDGNYSVKSSVKYENANGDELWFAKIRVDNSKENGIKIMGSYGGSWEQEDFEDEDLVFSNNPDFWLALNSMKTNLINICAHLSENKQQNEDLYDPIWVKQLKKYNK